MVMLHRLVDVSHTRFFYAKRPWGFCQNRTDIIGLQSRGNAIIRRNHCAPMRSRIPTAKVRSLAHFPLCYRRICVTYWSRTNLFALKGQGETALLRSHWAKYRTRTRTLTLEGSHASINTNLALWMPRESNPPLDACKALTPILVHAHPCGT